MTTRRFCAEEIKEAAVKCKHCGEFLDGRKSSGGVAAVLSLFLPGAGQVYNGEFGKGLGIFVLTVLGYTLLFPGLLMHFVAVSDAYSVGNGDCSRPWYSREYHLFRRSR